MNNRCINIYGSNVGNQVTVVNPERLPLIILDRISVSQMRRKIYRP